MGKKKVIIEDADELNIMPLMNIIMLLIPFLIMSTEFIKIGVINVSAPKLNNASTPQTTPQKKPKKLLNLTISVTRKGFRLLTRGNQIPDGCDISPSALQGKNKDKPTIAKVDGKYNVISLKKCLFKIKKEFPDEKRVIIMAEPEIKYTTISTVLDSSREKASGKSDLFPEVVLSAGVI
jgi:biopolymer transport protein ExbD